MQSVTERAYADLIRGGAEPAEEVEVLSRRFGDLILYGVHLPFAEHLYAAGTPPIWGLAKRPEPSERIAEVRIGDALTVTADAAGWTVSDALGVLGRATWRRGDNGRTHPRTGAPIVYPDCGILRVSQVLVSAGRVVDLGGIVTPTP